MWLSDLKVVLPDQVVDQASIEIQHGRIKQIISGSAPGDVPSLRGLTAIPGLIDLHGDMLERDVQPRPSARFPTQMGLIELDKRLAGTGITTAYAAISFAWSSTDLRSQASATEMIETLNALNSETLVDMYVHARFEVTNPETGAILRDLLERDLVQLVSIMDHTPGQGQYRNVDHYLNFIQQWLGIDPDVLGVDRETLDARMRSRIQEKLEAPRDWDVVRDVLQVAQAHNVPIASHDDDSADKVAQQAQMGVTISEFPVTLAAAQAAKDAGIYVIMGAPNAYRGQSTSNNLSAAEALQAGLVDILATDYYPAAMLHVPFKLARDGVMPLHEGIKLVSSNAADAMQLAERGRIAVGQSADIVLLHETDAFPRVRGTLRQGVPIHWDNHLANATQLSRLFKLEGQTQALDGGFGGGPQPRRLY